MKTIGLIGGLGPEATVDYYKLINKKFNDSQKGINFPQIVLYSVNMADFIDHFARKEFVEATDKFVKIITKLQQVGADFAAICANTPHLLFNDISKNSGFPMISIVESACAKAVALNLKRPGLIGTKFTMETGFYEKEFGLKGIEIVVPKTEEIHFLHNKLFTEIELGIFKDTTRDEILEIVNRMVKEDHIDSIILGCTEFPLILTNEFYFGIPALNTTAIHVEKIIEECLK